MKLTKGSQYPNQPPELRGALNNMRYPAFAEQKYDGEFTWIVITTENLTRKIHTVNKYGTERRDFPALNELLECTEGVEQAVLMAELYYGDGTNGSLYKLLSNKQSDDLNIKVFDIAEYDNEDIRHKPLIDRKELLYSLLSKKPMYLLKEKVVQDMQEVQAFFELCTETGKFEGIVVKPMDSPLIYGPCNWVKIKDKDQTAYPVVLIDAVKERIEVVCPVAGTTKTINVGVKVSNKDKATLSIGDMVIIEHQGVLESGSLRHPVFISKEGE